MLRAGWQQHLHVSVKHVCLQRSKSFRSGSEIKNEHQLSFPYSSFSLFFSLFHVGRFNKKSSEQSYRDLSYVSILQASNLEVRCNYYLPLLLGILKCGGEQSPHYLCSCMIPVFTAQGLICFCSAALLLLLLCSKGLLSLGDASAYLSPLTLPRWLLALLLHFFLNFSDMCS